MEQLDRIHETRKRQLLLQSKASVENAEPVWRAEVHAGGVIRGGPRGKCSSWEHFNRTWPRDKIMQRHRKLSSTPGPTSHELRETFPSVFNRKITTSLDQCHTIPDEIGGTVLRTEPINMSYCLLAHLHSTCHQKSLIYKKKKSIHSKELEFGVDTLSAK